MARRVTWTNNSTDYDGTNIYRDTTIDPQNLPGPIATVARVAQGAAVEYIDLTGTGDQCYAVRDFDSSGDGALSEAYCFELTTDWSQVSVGDEVEGGVYAGTITYADAREFHIMAGKASSEVKGLVWGNDGTTTGADDDDDGLANQDLILNSFDNGDSDAFYHCRDYTNDGFSDWYLPSINESGLVRSNLSGHAEFSDNTGSGDFTWSSTEENNANAWVTRFSDGLQTATNSSKSSTVRRTRPIRRVPA